MIPKIIHQTWKTHQVPEHWLAPQASWRALEKEGWTYRLWDDHEIRELIREHYPFFLSKFDKYPKGINRADVWRYFVLHKQGGMYVDLDIECHPDKFLPFFEMVKQEDLVLAETCTENAIKGQNLTNAWMLSQPNSPFWPQVWHQLYRAFADQPWKRLVSVIPHYKVLLTTGPGIINDVANKYPHPFYTIPSRLANNPQKKATEPIVTHHKGSSWYGPESRFFDGFKKLQTHKDWIMGGIIIACLTTITILSVIIHKRRPQSRRP